MALFSGLKPSVLGRSKSEINERFAPPSLAPNLRRFLIGLAVGPNQKRATYALALRALKSLSQQYRYVEQGSGRALFASLETSRAGFSRAPNAARAPPLSGRNRPFTCIVDEMFRRRFHLETGHPVVEDEHSASAFANNRHTRIESPQLPGCTNSVCSSKASALRNSGSFVAPYTQKMSRTATAVQHCSSGSRAYHRSTKLGDYLL